jgi:hypothetical protein
VGFYDFRRLANFSSFFPPTKQVGDGYCFHGDFINGWYEDAAKNMLKAKGQSFMRIDGSHGNGKQYSKCKAKDQDPENGTGDYHKSLEMIAAAKNHS